MDAPRSRTRRNSSLNPIGPSHVMSVFLVQRRALASSSSKTTGSSEVALQNPANLERGREVSSSKKIGKVQSNVGVGRPSPDKSLFRRAVGQVGKWPNPPHLALWGLATHDAAKTPAAAADTGVPPTRAATPRTSATASSRRNCDIGRIQRMSRCFALSPDRIGGGDWPRRGRGPACATALRRWGWSRSSRRRLSITWRRAAC